MPQQQVASQQPPTGELKFIEPCLPCIAILPPAGNTWVHEVKRDGRRMLARRDCANVRLFNHRGEDWTNRFPHIAEAVGMLPIRSCTIDGEVVGCDPDVMSDMDQDGEVALHAFDLLEVNGIDTRRDVIEDRKRTLAHLLRKIPDAIRFNPHFEREGKTVFELACKMGWNHLQAPRFALPVRPQHQLAADEEIRLTPKPVCFGARALFTASWAACQGSP